MNFLNYSFRLSVVFFTFLLFPSLLVAQEYLLRGTVIDALTSEGIREAQVFLRETGKTQRTDSSGFFSFAHLESGWYTIVVSHPMYERTEERIRLESTAPATITITLQPPLYRMPAVVVQSMRTAANSEQLPYPTAILEYSQLNENAHQTIAEALGKMPGLRLSRDGMWGTTVNVRGMSRYDVVLLTDGIRVETAQDLAGSMSLINPYDLDRVEVVKGPSYAGTGTIGGVVHYLSKVPTFRDQLSFQWEAMGRYESVNSLFGKHLAAKIESEQFRFRGSGMHRKAQNYETPDGTMPHSQFEDFGVSLFGGTKLFTSHLLNVSYERFHGENVGLPGGKSIAPTATATYKLARRELLKTEYSIPNMSTFVPLFTVRLAQQTIQRNVQLIASPTITKTPHATHTMRTMQAEGALTLSEDHYTTAGVEVWDRTIDSKRESYDAVKRTMTLERPLPDATFRSLGIFAHDEWTIIPEYTTLSFGGRYDAIHIENPTTYNIEWVIDSLGNKTVPSTRRLLWNAATRTTESWNISIGFHQRITGTLKLSLLTAAAERSATVEERFQFLSLGPNTYLGNPDLASERSYNVNVGAEWSSENIVVRGDVYSHFFVNFISDTLTLSNATTQTFSKYNIRRAKIYGYECTAQWYAFPFLRIGSSFSYTRGEDFSHRTNLPQIPPLRGAIDIHYRLPSYGTVTVECESIASQNYIAARTAGEVRTGGYTLFHLRFASVQFPLASTVCTFHAGIQNLFDKAYRNHLSTLRLLKLEPGRNIWFSLSVEG